MTRSLRRAGLLLVAHLRLEVGKLPIQVRLLLELLEFLVQAVGLELCQRVGPRLLLLNLVLHPLEVGGRAGGIQAGQRLTDAGLSLGASAARNEQIALRLRLLNFGLEL